MTTVGLEATGTPGSDAAISVSTRRLIFQKRNGAFWPLRIGRVPAGFALPVFGSPEAARRYLLACGLGPGWYVRMSSNGELASILSGLCRGVETVVLDPLPDGPFGGYALEMPRKRFLELLLGSSRGAPKPTSVPAL